MPRHYGNKCTNRWYDIFKCFLGGVSSSKRFSVDIPLENTKEMEQLDQRQIIVKIPQEITTGHARSRSDGLDKLKFEMLGNSLRQQNASKESPVACREQTISKQITKTRFVTLKTVQFQ